MPILHNAPVHLLSDAEFDEIDKVVMSCAYASQNKLGRLCEEAVYENDLAARLRAEGFSEVLTQVPIAVSFRGFEKFYRLDLIVQGMIYELKVVDGRLHERQLRSLLECLPLRAWQWINVRGTTMNMVTIGH